ncbi:response regulator [Hyalangium versicolor]|uniref:response regulator n=1 Tax=Hyalangium versicolor TaxID=2861190 RepID=UPI001CCD7EBC|nr:response regulator [Hyalangium versicolor]
MKPKVLIVDDSATVRADLEGVLTPAGFATSALGSVSGARKALAEMRFDLVILDVHLQDGDGVELLIQIRSEERTSHVPVLLLSTEAAVQARLRGLDRGANDYVGKPYDPSYVVKRARELTLAPLKSLESEPKLVAAARRRRVLVVDDSPTFLHAVVEELRKDGHDLIAAASAEEAMPMLKAQTVDCILMDLILPKMDGIAAARLIRADPKLATVPLLMFTDLFESKRMAEALAAGVDAFCPKASDLGLLRAQVRNLLRRGKESEFPTPPPFRAPAKSESDPGTLFARVVALSGLSTVIANTTIARACHRAHVDPEILDADKLTAALPFIREALRVFLTEHETRMRMVAIEDLTHQGRWLTAGNSR